MSGASEEDQTPPPPRRMQKRYRLILGLAVLLVAGMVGLWLFRMPLATRILDRELARRGVRARYDVEALGFGGQRLANVVFGDPRNPDLVADWLETQTRITLSGPEVVGVLAGRVRIRGRLKDGRVSLGSLDRLMPPPSGKPFSLPDLFVDVQDGRIRLETPAGPVGIAVRGRGQLNDGFAGRIAAIAPSLQFGSCTFSQVATPLRLRIVDAKPAISGVFRVGDARCGDARWKRVAADVSVNLGAAMDRWQGQARLMTDAFRHPLARAAAMRGTISFAGSVAKTSGQVDLAAERVTAEQGTARALSVSGRYGVGDVPRFEGRVRLGGGVVAPRVMADVAGMVSGGQGTPVAPLASALARAVRAAGAGFAVEADVQARGGEQTAVEVARLTLASRSGARVALAGGSGLHWRADGARIDTRLAMAGGGMPQVTATLAQARVGAPVRGTATLAPYRAGGAMLALDRMRFSAALDGATRIETRATLSGPLGDGRIERLVVPVEARWDGRRRLIVNPGCAPVAAERVAVSGLVLSGVALRLCPVDGAVVRVDGTRVSGGARVATARLAGRLGGTPVTLAAQDATLRLSDRGFVLSDVAARLGSAERVTRLNIGRLEGRIEGGAVSGFFAGAGGQIANVPLLLNGARGTWRLAGGALTLNGVLDVDDAAETARFQRMAARDVTLSLVNGRVHATGTLYEPSQTVKVADVTIDHQLSSGTGAADLRVPGLTFTETFQPTLLTMLTYGVIADVRGTVRGDGHIAWGADGVTSTGTFATDGTDLAAAFGPVKGINGTIRFTDLLALESAPDQVATIKSINPGIAVTDGVIRYRTLRDTRVKVEGGAWPFAGGSLTLDPTLLDFSQPAERRMTFHVRGAAADQFLQQFDFENLNATGVFDGELPMVFDDRGGRIEQGSLMVREGGGTLAYVGDLSQKDLGLWGNLAFGALRSLRYRTLGVTMNGPLAGEMVTDVRFTGVSQGKGAKSNFLIRRLQRLPFVFNIRIKAPFRGLLDSAQSFWDPKRLVQRNLQSLIEEQNKRAAPPAGTAPTGGVIQPPASGTVPKTRRD
ncbi:YdbH domain-containing protein [Sphingomonas sp. NY01]|uniref:YdbH domain-containing protein n=1 Tax=Sphingomonas sp. NY01 TaxID=2968057 RepID=UPI00315CB6FD